MIAPPISSTSTSDTTSVPPPPALVASLSGALLDVTNAISKLATANTALSTHQARLTQLRDLTTRAHDHVRSFYSHDQDLLKIVNDLVGVSSALTALVDGPTMSVPSYSPLPITNPPVTAANPVATPSTRTHEIRPWAGSSRGPMSDTASEYSDMSSVRYTSSVSGSASTPLVVSPKWTRGPPVAVGSSGHGNMSYPKEVDIACRLALEKTGAVLPVHSHKGRHYVAAGVLGFLTGTYSSLRSANNTISRHVREYGLDKSTGDFFPGICKVSERWYITIDAFKTHIMPHIRNSKDIWAAKE
ncbi:hypothetical protein AMAG_06237 [Allomyces macrogynus ATCC 38327]|uniref:Uncharacterized protein n=1 Tax=Allomyces macrogynus (strain ATCC 38327) TaxID=578462 RepID=A0A0L0SG25_ALLM3|nr:hypothetical protein AMAG_06237 [Allomyces macrogynus ATCC 38327]|eukprot:KNE61407.1 hypothetical protein AMAG_06237 [Allomyces macrogynus ATCC 38327]